MSTLTVSSSLDPPSVQRIQHRPVSKIVEKLSHSNNRTRKSKVPSDLPTPSKGIKVAVKEKVHAIEETLKEKNTDKKELGNLKKVIKTTKDRKTGSISKRTASRSKGKSGTASRPRIKATRETWIASDIDTKSPHITENDRAQSSNPLILDPKPKHLIPAHSGISNTVAQLKTKENKVMAPAPPTPSREAALKAHLVSSAFGKKINGKPMKSSSLSKSFIPSDSEETDGSMVDSPKKKKNSSTPANTTTTMNKTLTSPTAIKSSKKSKKENTLSSLSSGTEDEHPLTLDHEPVKRGPGRPRKVDSVLSSTNTNTDADMNATPKANKQNSSVMTPGSKMKGKSIKTPKISRIQSPAIESSIKKNQLPSNSSNTRTTSDMALLKQEAEAFLSSPTPVRRRKRGDDDDEIQQERKEKRAKVWSDDESDLNKNLGLNESVPSFPSPNWLMGTFKRAATALGIL